MHFTDAMMYIFHNLEIHPFTTVAGVNVTDKHLFFSATFKMVYLGLGM